MIGRSEASPRKFLPLFLPVMPERFFNVTAFSDLLRAVFLATYIPLHDLALVAPALEKISFPSLPPALLCRLLYWRSFL